jgi:hypothetical protein
MMEMTVLVTGLRRRVICVAYRVQRPWPRGNEKPVMLSSSELLPDDWLPTTTIWACGQFWELCWVCVAVSLYLRSGDVDTDLAELVLLLEVDVVTEAVDRLGLDLAHLGLSLSCLAGVGSRALETDMGRKSG